MAKKPDRLSEDTIWREKIDPKELDSWVKYVQEALFEYLQKAGESVSSKEDIGLEVYVKYKTTACHIFYNSNGHIGVRTIRAGGFKTCNIIAYFSSSVDAKETFKEYASFKNTTNVYKKESLFSTHEEITVI